LGLAESVLAEQGDEEGLAKAIMATERAVALDPDWALNYANLGALYRASNDLSRAREWLEEAVQRAPDVGVYHLNLGVIAEELGDGEAASQAYRLALEKMGWGREVDFWVESDLRGKARQVWLASFPNQIERMTVDHLTEFSAIYPGEITSVYYNLAAFRKPTCFLELALQAAYLDYQP
jgi:tetratricopeptide (TPR) repeat protein